MDIEMEWQKIILICYCGTKKDSSFLLSTGRLFGQKMFDKNSINKLQFQWCF